MIRPDIGVGSPPIVATGGKIGRVVTRCLGDFGYDYLASPSANDIRFESVIEKGKPTWRSQILIDEEHELVRLFIFLTDEWYLAHRRLWVAELAARSSDALAIGSIEFDWDTGSAHYRNSLDLRGTDTTPHAIGIRLLNPSAFTVRLWDRAYGCVSSPKITPKEALEAALIAMGVNERGSVISGCPKVPLALIK
jgi:hypothetical protein